MEKYSFFNDVNGDRSYFAEDFARHLAKYFTNGVFNNECMITANNNDMTITRKSGSANIEGYRYDDDNDLILSIENADGVLNRIDNVVIRLDLTNRTITSQVIKGTFAENPVAPNLIRTSTIYDLRIAKISIPAGTTTITQDLVTDTRFITSDCGNVISAVETPDTENLFIQIQAQFENKMQELNSSINSVNETVNTSLVNWKQTFDTWFEEIQNTLNGDVAGNLLNKINNLENKMVSDNDYVHTDNNFTSKYKDKLDKLFLSFDTVLEVTNWSKNETTNFFDYRIDKEDITDSTFVDGVLDIINAQKLSLSEINSYDGYFIISTIEKPKTNINIKFVYNKISSDVEVEENAG